MRDLGDVVHAAAEERHLAAIFGGHIQNLLQPVNRGAEAGDHQPPLGAIEDFFQARPHRAFAFGVAGPVDVGRIRHQQQHAALAVIGEGVQIEQLVVGGRGVHFEIAGVNDDAQRRGDGQRHRADDGVRDVDELDGERAELDPRAGLDLVQLGIVQHAVLFQAPLHQRQREGGAVDRHVDLAQQKRHRADVILVAVRQDQRADDARGSAPDKRNRA